MSFDVSIEIARTVLTSDLFEMDITNLSICRVNDFVEFCLQSLSGITRDRLEFGAVGKDVVDFAEVGFLVQYDINGALNSSSDDN